jgi:lipoprotein-anchoring transpeptidase ErfK/SrfK
MTVKLLAVALVLIGNLAASQAHAQTASSQPLTRADCESAGLAWNEGANICNAATAPAGQPLTRADCGTAGMVWNENGNVCGGQAAPASDTAAAPAGPDKSAIFVSIDKATQRMTVFVNGEQRYEWPVSTGLNGYSTPSGNYTARSMNKIWYSKQWDNAPMPHAVFFTKEGHAIHATYEVKRLGKPASHGCVRLSPKNAETLFSLVEENGLENTEIVLVGLTPGGESKVANASGSKQRYRAEAFNQPQRRGGFFKRLFGAR